MVFRIDRRIVFGLTAVATVAFGLVLVARGLAGSQEATYSTFVAPTQATGSPPDFATNQSHPPNKAVAGAKFAPTGPNGGAATHVVMTLNLPSDVPAPTANDPSPILVTACPGTATVDNVAKVVRCNVSSVQAGTVARLLVEFTVPVVPTAEAWQLTGTVTWDAGGGSNGATNSQPASPVGSVTIYPAGGGAAGTCAPTSSSQNSLAVTDPVTQKSATVSFGTVDNSTGLPCTPAQAAIDPTQVQGASTLGSWTLLVAPLANGALGNAVLTISNLPAGITPKTAILYEVLANGTLQQVLACVKGAMPNSSAHVCLIGQTKSGPHGVAFTVLFVATGVDPRVTS
jgi:hypothetical protein